MNLISWMREKNNQQTMVFLGILIALCYRQWQRMSPDNDYIIDALQYNPNGYRLWTQFLILLDQQPIAYVAWVAIIFVPVSWYLYIESPEDSKLMIFAWLVLTVSTSSIRQSPAFVLLALAIILSKYKWSWLMVLPMTIAKEHAGIVYVIYLLTMKRYKTAIMAGILWAITFFGIRLLIGEVGWRANPDTGEILTTPILTLAPYIIRLQMPRHILNIFFEITLSITFLRDRTEVMMILANLPFITFFGFFYEAQLWLMVIVAIVYKRRIENNEFTNYPNGVSKAVA